MGKLTAALIGLMIIASGGWAQAEEEEYDTLEKIKATGEIVVGHRRSSVPFSYYDQQGNVVGYAMFYTDLIIEAIKKELNRPDLKVKYVLLTSSDRLRRLSEGEYDFACGSTASNLERREQVAFSNIFFIVGTRLLVDKDSVINDFDDLEGRRVVVTSGTTTEKMLQEMNAKKRMNISIISAADHGEAFGVLESGQAEAFFLDDALLAGERAKAENPDRWIIVGTPQSYEAYGCTFRKGDERFKALADEVVAEAQLSGAALKAYNQWFRRPIPPSRRSLNFELPEIMKELFAAPNDRAYQ